MEGTMKVWFDFRGFGDVKGLTIPEIGDTAEFEIANSAKGPRAVNVELK